MVTKARKKNVTPDTERMTPEEYEAYLEKINREAPNELERLRRIGEIIKRHAVKRDMGDFDSTAIVRLMRDGLIDM